MLADASRYDSSCLVFNRPFNLKQQVCLDTGFDLAKAFKRNVGYDNHSVLKQQETSQLNLHCCLIGKLRWEARTHAKIGWESERGRGQRDKRERERDKEREDLCVCECVGRLKLT